MRNRSRHTGVLMLAAALIGVSAAPAEALIWGPPQPITTSGEAASSPGAMTTFWHQGDLITVVAYQEPVDDRLVLFLKVSDDGGDTWSGPRRASTSSDNEVVASRPALASGTLPEQLHLAYVSERSDGSSKVI